MRARLFFLCLFLMAVLAGCPGKKGGIGGDPSASIVLKDDSTGLLLTWIDEKGDFHVEQKVPDVPLVGRDAVRVVDPSREEGTRSDKVFVADVRQAGPDGAYPVKTMTRAEFENIAVARREKKGPTLASASSSAPLPPGTERPQTDPNANGRPAVIIYGADWCGACHEAASYLTKKGITYVEKNVEKDRAASQEMQQKLKSAGLHGGSIPVLDVRGKVLVGFNPRSVDDALGKAL